MLIPPRSDGAQPAAIPDQQRLAALVTKRRSAAFAAVALVTDVSRGVTGEDADPIFAVGRVEFMIRLSSGSGRMLTGGDARGAEDAHLEDTAPIRGTLCVAGPPAHSVGELFFADLPSAAGAIWRAVMNIPEPGMCMDVVLEHDVRTLIFEHVARAIIVTVVDTSGHVISRRSYDPFALLDGLVGACERVEQTLRAQHLTSASKSFHRQYMRPAFPRVVPDGER